MTSLQYWENQFKKYGEPYYKYQFNKCILEEFINMTIIERRNLINYLKKSSLLDNINSNTDLLNIKNKKI